MESGVDMGYSYNRCQRGLWGRGSLVMVHGPDHCRSPGIVLGLWYGGVSHLRVLVGEEELKCVNPLCPQAWGPNAIGTYFIELDPDHPNYEAVEQKKHARRRRKDWEEETRRRSPPGPRKKRNRNVKDWLT